MTTADTLRQQAARRTADAIREALDQLANGWTDDEVLTVATDAWDTIADLKDQADAVDELNLAAIAPQLWETACQQASPMHRTLRCYLQDGHYPATGHLYSVRSYRTTGARAVAS